MRSLLWITAVLGFFTPTLVKSKSLTFIVDGTYSFASNLKDVESGVVKIINRMTNSSIDKYVLVIVREPSSTIERHVFKNGLEVAPKIRNIIATPSPDCSEPILESIMKGINDTLSDSSVFVFTDASPDNTAELQNEIFRNCLERRIRLNFFITGRCVGRSDQIYTSLAHGTDGHIFTMEINQMEQIFAFIDVFCDPSYQTIVLNETETTEKIIVVPIDDSVERMIVYATGKDSVLRITNAEPIARNQSDHFSLQTFKFENKSTNVVIVKSTVSSGLNRVRVLIKSPIRVGYYFHPQRYAKIFGVEHKIISNLFSKYVFIQKEDGFTPISVGINNRFMELHASRLGKEGMYTTTQKMFIPFGMLQIEVKGISDTKEEINRLIVPPILFERDHLQQDQSAGVKEFQPYAIKCSAKLYENERLVLKKEGNGTIVEQSVWAKNVTQETVNITENENDRNGYNLSYNCIVEEKDQPTYEDANLEVNIYASPLVVRIPEQNVTVREGKNVLLKCQILPNTGEKRQNLWKFNKGKVQNYANMRISTTNLLIRNISRIHSGYYSCSATQGDVIKSDRIFVDVTYPVKSAFFLNDTHQTTDQVTIYESEMSAVKVHCKGEGNPKPVSWIEQSRNDTMILETNVARTVNLTCYSRNDNSSNHINLTISIITKYKPSEWSTFKECEPLLRCEKFRWRKCVDENRDPVIWSLENSRRFCTDPLDERIRANNATWLGYNLNGRLIYCRAGQEFDPLGGKCKEQTPIDTCKQIGLKCEHYCIHQFKICGCRQGYNIDVVNKGSCIVDNRDGDVI